MVHIKIMKHLAINVWLAMITVSGVTLACFGQFVPQPGRMDAVKIPVYRIAIVPKIQFYNKKDAEAAADYLRMRPEYSGKDQEYVITVIEDDLIK